MGIHVSLGRSHKNTNNVFLLVNPVYDMDMYIIFKATVFMKQSKSEWNPVYFSPAQVFNM